MITIKLVRFFGAAKFLCQRFKIYFSQCSGWYRGDASKRSIVLFSCVEVIGVLI